MVAGHSPGGMRMRHGTTSARFRRTHQPGTAGKPLKLNSTLLTMRVRFDRPRFRRSPDLLLHETGRLAAEVKEWTATITRPCWRTSLPGSGPSTTSSVASAPPITTCGPHRPGPSCSRTTRLAGDQADYVLLWGVHQAEGPVREDPSFITAMRELASGYRLISVSEPHGSVEVYMRR